MGILNFGNVPAAESNCFSLLAHARKPFQHIFLVVMKSGFSPITTIHFLINRISEFGRTMLVAWPEDARSRLVESTVPAICPRSSGLSYLAFVEQRIGCVAAVQSSVALVKLELQIHLEMFEGDEFPMDGNEHGSSAAV